MSAEVVAALSALAERRPVFHSERDFQHALAWQLQLSHPQAQIRLEPRPRRSVHLDLLVRLGGQRTAIELKYLVAGLRATVDGEVFDLPNQSAQDISRHDVIKDITRVETLIADGYADAGVVVVLSNDRSYWNPPRADTIDAQFRIHEGRILDGTVSWAERAGRGTTTGRDTPLRLAGRYVCRWHDYSQVTLAGGRPAQFRYLMINAQPGSGHTPAPVAETEMRPEPVPVSRAAPLEPGNARSEILMVARKLATRSPDGSFTVGEIVAEMQRVGTRYADSTIRTHVVSRMCADAPDHHAVTFDDFERLGGGRYRVRRTG